MMDPLLWTKLWITYYTSLVPGCKNALLAFKRGKFFVDLDEGRRYLTKGEDKESSYYLFYFWFSVIFTWFISIVVERFILFLIFGYIHPLMFVVVVIFIIFSVKFTMFTFVVVKFLVMFTDFSHIHSVILIRSSE